jgi:hypothetical protein
VVDEDELDPLALGRGPRAIGVEGRDLAVRRVGRGRLVWSELRVQLVVPGVQLVQLVQLVLLVFLVLLLWRFGRRVVLRRTAREGPELGELAAADDARGVQPGAPLGDLGHDVEPERAREPAELGDRRRERGRVDVGQLDRDEGRAGAGLAHGSASP